MKKLSNTTIPGQITLWDIEVTKMTEKITEKPTLIIETEVLDTKKPISNTELPSKDTNLEVEKIAKHLELTAEQQDFLAKNRVYENENLNRIIYHCSGGLVIELAYEESYKSTYVNTKGKEELSIAKKSPVLPMDKILYHKCDNLKANNTQEEKLTALLKNIAPKRIIRRKGDENILLELEDKVISINSLGWVLEFNGIGIVEDSKEELRPKNIEDEIAKLGDTVEAYLGKKRVVIGVIAHIYNNNETFNINYDNKQTAVHKSRIIRVLKSA